jgi:ABC-type phosphate/phosphonate transport system substrate-binding protein
VTIASLAMYPFSWLRPAYDELWNAVRRQLSFPTPALDWSTPAHVAWRMPDLLVGQTCGWPLITQLADAVAVVGTFDHDVIGGADGTYCSMLVTQRAGTLDEVLHEPGLRVAANSVDSLSGWVSLHAVAHDHGVELDDVIWTGSHVASIDALRAGRVTLASIDAVTWAHLDRGDLRVVGYGPRVPCLPLITATRSLVKELRDAFAAATTDPALVDELTDLRIRGFVEFDLADYQPLRQLPLGR